nr:hypothetical protein [Tanacetum cinerariifolium]
MKMIAIMTMTCSEGNDQESDSGDNNTQSYNEKGSDSEHETHENETGFESDQEENEEETLPKKVSNFAPPVIQSMVTESLDHAVLDKESSQPQSTSKAVVSLTKFELKKILINKMDKSQSYLTATKHREYYDGLIKSYDLDKKELEFEVADSDMPQDQEENLGNDDEEPKRKAVFKCDWFTKSKQPQEPTDLDWNVGKTPQQGPTQSYDSGRGNAKTWKLPDSTSGKRTYTLNNKDPQGFIYVENLGRNRLMHSDELYMFGDGTLTRLQSSLDDITKNIQMEYLPQRRRSSLK